MKIKRFVCNALAENCYVVSSGSSCIIIDPGFDHGGLAVENAETGALPAETFSGEGDNDAGGASLNDLAEYLCAEGLQPEAILLTHSHPDHTLGVAALVEHFGIPVFAARADKGPDPCPENGFSAARADNGPDSCPEQTGAFAGEMVKDAGATIFGFTVIATPGHTPDSVCYYNEAAHVLFTGDTLFAGTIGRTDLPGGDYDQEIVSIMEKLIFLPGETEISPGHGPASTIARERRDNPFLEPFNEREELGFGA